MTFRRDWRGETRVFPNLTPNPGLREKDNEGERLNSFSVESRSQPPGVLNLAQTKPWKGKGGNIFFL